MREDSLILPEGRNQYITNIDERYTRPGLEKCGPLGSVKDNRLLLYTTPGLDVKTGRRKGVLPKTYIMTYPGRVYFVIKGSYGCLSKFMKQLGPEERESFEDDLPEILDLLGLNV